MSSPSAKRESPPPTSISTCGGSFPAISSRGLQAFNQFPDRPLVAIMGAAMFAPLALIADLQLRHERGAKVARRRARRPPAPGRGAPARVAGPTFRRPPKIAALAERLGPETEDAHPPLLGAAGLARRRGRGDVDRGSRGRREIRRRANPRRPRRASWALEALGRSTFTALKSPAPVQPQRLLGAVRAAPAAGPRRMPILRRRPL